MALKVGCFLTVWDVKPTQYGGEMVRVTSSYKSKQTGNWVQDFGSNVFLGRGVASMKNLAPKTRIILDEFSVTNKYDKTTKRESWMVTVWKWHLPEEENDNGEAQGVVGDDPDKLPF